MQINKIEVPVCIFPINSFSLNAYYKKVKNIYVSICLSVLIH